MDLISQHDIYCGENSQIAPNKFDSVNKAAGDCRWIDKDVSRIFVEPENFTDCEVESCSTHQRRFYDAVHSIK